MKYSREYWTILNEVVQSDELNIRDKIITIHNIIRTIDCKKCYNHYATMFKNELLHLTTNNELVRWFQQFYNAANNNK